MQKRPLLMLAAVAAAGLTCPPAGARQDERQTPETDAIFDLEEKKEKRSEPEKERAPDAAPDPALPAEAAALLEKLEADVKAARSQLLERVRQNRNATAAKLIALADRAAVTQRAKLLEAAAHCAKEAPEKRLAHPAGFPAGQWIVGEWNVRGGEAPRALLPDGNLKLPNLTGTWRWIDAERGFALCDWHGSEHVDLIRLKDGSRDTADWQDNYGGSSVLKRAGPERFSLDDPAVLLSLASRQEEQWRAVFQNQTAAARAQVYGRLMAQVRTVKGPPGIALLRAAVKLQPAAATEALEYADRLQGEWRSPAGRVFTFLPHGAVQEEDRSAGTWRWAKHNNRKTALVVLNLKNPQKPEVFLARRSSEIPGLLRTYSLDAAPGELVRQ